MLYCRTKARGRTAHCRKHTVYNAAQSHSVQCRTIHAVLSLNCAQPHCALPHNHTVYNAVQSHAVIVVRLVARILRAAAPRIAARSHCAQCRAIAHRTVLHNASCAVAQLRTSALHSVAQSHCVQCRAIALRTMSHNTSLRNSCFMRSVPDTVTHCIKFCIMHRHSTHSTMLLTFSIAIRRSAS